MKNLSLFLLLCVLFGTNARAQTKFGEYKSYFAFANNALLDNKQYGVETNPRKYHLGGGVGIGLSVNDNFNLLVGLNYMLVKPMNNRSDYSFCESPSCLPISASNQLFLPIGVEYYGNTDMSPFQLFYTLRLVPAFSVTEVTEVIPFDEFQSPQPSYQVENNGLKFQDLQIEIAINNEFSLSQKFKIYLEPSVSHSILFRAEDFINPDYVIALKVGFRIRKNN